MRLPIWQAARRPGAVQPFDCRGRRAPFGMAPAALLDTLAEGARLVTTLVHPQ